MGGWTGIGKDGISWDGVISINGVPAESKDLTTKAYVDTEILTCWLKSLGQTGLTGDKTGSFNLSTTGDGSFGDLNVNGVTTLDETIIVGDNSAAGVDAPDFLTATGGTSPQQIADNGGKGSDEVKTTGIGGDCFSAGQPSPITAGAGGDSIETISAGGDGTHAAGGAATGGRAGFKEIILSSGGTGAGGGSSGADGYMRIGDGSSNYVQIDRDGNIIQVGTGRTHESEKFKLTAIGGYAIKLTNKTGGNTVAGTVVCVYTATAIDDAFVSCPLSDDGAIGIVLDAGVSDGSEAWVVVSGIADVLMDAGGAVRGDRITTSGNTVGSGDVWNTGGAVARHFQEIGHCIESIGAGAGLARCVVHFL